MLDSLRTERPYASLSAVGTTGRTAMSGSETWGELSVRQLKFRRRGLLRHDIADPSPWAARYREDVPRT